VTLRVPCGAPEPPARKVPEGGCVDIDDAFALLAELELRDVEDLDRGYFEAELQGLLPLA
jgi:hypothetical protein